MPLGKAAWRAVCTSLQQFPRCVSRTSLPSAVKRAPSRRACAPLSREVCGSREANAVAMGTRTVVRPAVTESGQARAALTPTDAHGVWPFAETMIARAEKEVAADVIQPPAKNGARPVEAPRVPFPDRGERPAFAVAAPARLRRRVVVRMNDNGFRAVNDAVALSVAPARVLVVFGVLHLFQESAPGPNILA